MAFVAGSFFTAGLAVIPQNVCLALWFFVASVVFGLLAIYLHHSIHKRHEKRIRQVTEYIKQGEQLRYKIPKTIEEFAIWRTAITKWRTDAHSWLDSISPADAVFFLNPGDRPNYDYVGFDGKENQAYINTLVGRLENLREILVRYLSRND